jgi:hypothetical protein
MTFKYTNVNMISIIPKNIDIPIYRKFQYRVIGIYKKTIIIGISIYRNSLVYNKIPFCRKECIYTALCTLSLSLNVYTGCLNYRVSKFNRLSCIISYASHRCNAHAQNMHKHCPYLTGKQTKFFLWCLHL